MQILKPYDHTALSRICYFGRQPVLSISVICGFQLSQPNTLAAGSVPWKAAGSLLGKQELLDEGFAKPRAEFLAAAVACAPRGTTTQGIKTSISLAGHTKELLAFGDRYWLDKHRSSDPQPFSSMPMTWQNAFGGAEIPENPEGKGIAPVTGDNGAQAIPLPNIESPGHAVQAQGDRPPPAGFGALPVLHPLRASCQGTYDEAWIAKHAPGFAHDTDPAFFHCASPDQRLDGWLQGGETYVLVNLHPDHARLEGCLPQHRTRAFLFGNEERWQEVTLHLDTVWFMPHLDLGILIRHGNLKIDSEATSPWSHLMVGYERSDVAPRPSDHYRAVHARWLDPLKRFSDLRLERSLIPQGARPPTFLAYKDPDVIEKEVAALEAEARGEATLAYPESWPEVQPPEVDDQSTQPAALRAGLAAALATRGLALPAGIATAEKAKSALAAANALDEDTASRLAAAQALEESAQAQGNGTTYTPALSPSQMAEKRIQLEQMLAAHADCAGLDLAGMDLTSLDFSGCNLEGANLAGVDASGVPFVGANLTGVNVTQANLAHADFSQANLTSANFSHSNLQEANLSQADARESMWSHTEAEGACLTGAILHAAQIEYANFCNADAASADFSSALVLHSSFDQANFQYARWESATCLRSDFTHVHAEDCNAATMILHACDLTQSDWSKANLAKSIASGRSTFSDANIAGACLEGASWSECDLTQTNCDEAVLTKATFCKIEGQGLSLKKADAVGSIWNESNLTGLHAQQANLMQASFHAANLTRASFHQANLFQASLQGAICKDTDIGEALFADHIKALLEKGILP